MKKKKIDNSTQKSLVVFKENGIVKGKFNHINRLGFPFDGVINCDTYLTVLPISPIGYRAHTPTKASFKVTEKKNQITFYVTDDCGQEYQIIVKGQERTNPAVVRTIKDIKNNTNIIEQYKTKNEDYK